MERYLAVIGAGPVGSIVAANFAAAGEKVLVVDVAAARCEQIRRSGLTVKGRQSVSAKPAAVVGSVRELKGQPLSALFLCTKTWTLRSVLPDLVQAVEPDTRIVSFQNGIGTEDEVAACFPRGTLARGIVSYAGEVVAADGTVTMHWFTPPNYIGPLDDRNAAEFEPLAKSLSDAGLTTAMVSCHEIKRQAFFKGILNSALNALCAVSGITMQQAMTYPHTRSLAALLIREGLSVASAAGYNYGEDAFDQCLKYLDAGGKHLPSMWSDLQHGSPTEIEYINGKIVEIGEMYKNVDVVANRFFTALIVTQEIKSGARQPTEIPAYLNHY